MTQEPVKEMVPRWMCPICRQRFDMRDYCKAHIKDQHPEPTPEALALIGSFLSFEVLNRRYVMRVDRATEDTVVGGPAVVLGWEGRVEFEESYWILCDKVEHTVLDEDGARAAWSEMCEGFVRELSTKSRGAWDTMQSRRPRT